MCPKAHRHFRHTSGTHDGDCGRLAGGEVADLLGSRDQVADIGRIVRHDTRRLVPEEELAILELNAGGTQAIAVRVLEIVNPDRPEPGRAGPSYLTFVALRRRAVAPPSTPIYRSS